MLELLATLLRVVGGVLIVAASLTLHLGSANGRRAVRDLVTSVLPGLVPGQLTLREVVALSPRRIVLDGLSWRDDRGHPVVEDAHLEVGAAWRFVSAPLAHTAWPTIRLRARRGWARVPELGPARVVSGAPPHGPSAPITLRLPAISVDIERLDNALGGPALIARNLRGDAAINIVRDRPEVSLRLLRVDLWLESLPPVHLEAAAEVHGERAVDGRVDIQGEPLRCELRASSRGGEVSLRARHCAVSASALGQLAGARMPAVAVREATLVRAVDDALSLQAELRVGDDDIGLRAESHHGDHHLTLRPRAVTLRWVEPALPPISLNGAITARATRRGAGWDLGASTRELVATVAGVQVPGLDLAARYEGTELQVSSLRVPTLKVTAQGSIDTALGVSSARAELHARGMPLTRLVVPGVALRGALDIDAELLGSRGGIRLSVNGRGRELSALDAQAAALGLNGSLSVSEGRSALRAHLDLTGLRAAGQGPLHLVMDVDGDAQRSLAVRARVDGDVPAAARARLHGAHFALSVTGAVSRDARRTRVRVARADLRAGRLALHATALADLRSDDRGTRPELVETTVTLPGEGALSARLRSQRLELGLRNVALRALADIAPELAPLGGIVDGEASVDLRRPSSAAVDLRVRELDAPVLGRISPHLTVTPGPGGRSAIRLQWNAAVPGGDCEIDLRIPRAVADARAWIDGIEGGTVGLPTLELSSIQSSLPRGLRLRGGIAPRVVLSRRDARTLDVEATVEGSELVLGVGVLRLQRDLVLPLRLRAKACGSIDPRRDFSDPWRTRVALGVAAENADAPPAFGCADDARPLPMPLVEASAGVEGPWRAALAGLRRSGLSAIPTAVAAQMRAVPLHASLQVGPLTRARWPLRAVRVPGLPASLRALLAPELEADTRASVSARLGGTLAAPTLDAQAEASAPRLSQLQLAAPLRASVELAARPTGADLAAPFSFEGALRAELGTEADAPARGVLSAASRALSTLPRLLANARDLDVETLRASAQNLRLEHVSTLAERGMRGGLDLTVSQTGDPARPYDARLSLHDLRTIPPGLERIAAAIPPVSAALHAVVTREGAVAETARVCLLASAGQTPTECAPRSPEDATPVPEGALRADLELPFPRGMLELPDLARLALAVRASTFRVDALGALAPASVVTDLGGVISAALQWRATDPVRPVGRFELRDGRATLASLGEPFEELNVALSVSGRRVHIERFDGRLGQGTLRVTGDAALGRGDEIARVALEARTRELPAVSGGHTWAWVTGAMGTELVLRRTGVLVNVRIHEATVRVQDEPARALIPLSGDPAVFVRGRTRLTRVEAADVLPVDINFTLETPMSLRRSDFLVDINGAGHIRMDRAGTAVAANFSSARSSSWVSFYGKRFDLERVRVSLDGSTNVNPQIDLIARHDGGAIGNVVLSLQGRLYDPRISMTSERQPELGMAEVLSLLIMGRRETGPTTGQSDLATQAGAMARSLVTGLTLGFVTSTLRAQFAFLPTIIAEPGTADAGRYGAGFNLGPRVYLQATWGTASSAVGLGTRPPGTQEFRVLLEYAITSVLSGTTSYSTWQEYGSWQNSAGVDVFWSP